MDKKTMFELFKDKKFPKEVQKQLDDFYGQGETNEECWFRAGFLCRMLIEKGEIKISDEE